MTIDIGTKADEGAITKLFKFMNQNPKCGGCVGEIEADLDVISDENKSSWLTWSMIYMQFYEYKAGYAPCKNTESFFGYLQCLPGAYAFFRWNAVKGEPLEMFFKLLNQDRDPTPFEANEYLTEDRIISANIYVKSNENYYLAYIPDAMAKTDVPEDLETLLVQRRRWLNGTITGEIRIFANSLKLIGLTGPSHGIYQRLLVCTWITWFLFWRLFSFCCGSLCVIGQKYLILYGVNYFCDTPEFKLAHPSLHASIIGKGSDWTLNSILNFIFFL